MSDKNVVGSLANTSACQRIWEFQHHVPLWKRVQVACRCNSPRLEWSTMKRKYKNDSTVRDLKITSKYLQIEIISTHISWSCVLNILSTRFLFLSVDPTKNRGVASTSNLLHVLVTCAEHFAETPHLIRAM